MRTDCPNNSFLTILGTSIKIANYIMLAFKIRYILAVTQKWWEDRYNGEGY